LAIRQNVWGSPHPRVAESLVLLAQICQSHHRVDEAECLYGQALDIYEAVYDETSHPDMVKALDRYAALMHATGRREPAEAIAERAHQVRQALGRMASSAARR
jgi:hypothetical protein